jgi:galactokinase
VDHVLRANGFALPRGYDAVIAGNVPGGGMSRSASISINLILHRARGERAPGEDGIKIVEMAQQVENDYIGSPCGQLDQIMIYFAKRRHGHALQPRHPHDQARRPRAAGPRLPHRQPRHRHRAPRSGEVHLQAAPRRVR